MRRRDLWLLGLAAGVLLTAGLPPFGWWPLALVGTAILAWAVADRPWRRRAELGLAAGLGLCLPGLFWMTEFSLPGFVLASALEAALVGLAALLTPGSRPWALPAGLVAAEALRGWWPFGGVPVATVAQTQLGGPFDDVARLLGALGVTATVGLAGLAVASVGQRRARRAAAAAGAVVALAAAASAVPVPRTVGRLDVALVQGGGPRGTRAVDTDDDEVLERHLAASRQVTGAADVVLWPEDVIDIDEPIRRSAAHDDLEALAVRTGSTVVAGVVTDVGRDRFDNEAVAWGPDGTIVDTYRKNQRVPFGEFIPWRSVVDSVADISAVPRDATVGRGPGLLRTEAGRLGVVISYEVFFARRARAAVRAGGEILLVPTNASSYSSTQMPALELGAARLRAIESGRDVVQAAPTGFSAAVTPNGRVTARSDLGRRQVLTVAADRRRGQTPYTRLGDGPIVAVTLLVLVVAGALARRRDDRLFRPRGGWSPGRR